jgi:hypothetical protein
MDSSLRAVLQEFVFGSAVSLLPEYACVDHDQGEKCDHGQCDNDPAGQTLKKGWWRQYWLVLLLTHDLTPARLLRCRLLRFYVDLCGRLKCR